MSNKVIISKLNQIHDIYKRKLKPNDSDLKPIISQLNVYNDVGVDEFISDEFIVELFNKIQEVNEDSLNDDFINKLLPGITKTQIDFIFKNPSTSYERFLELKDKKIRLQGLDGQCPTQFSDFIDNFLFAPCLFFNLIDQKRDGLNELELANRELEIDKMLGSSPYLNLIKNLYTTAQNIGDEKFERVIFMASILFNTKSADLYYDLMTKEEQEQFTALKDRTLTTDDFEPEYSDNAIKFLDKLAMKFSTAFSTSGDIKNVNISNLEMGLKENINGEAFGTVDAAWPVLHEVDGEIVCTPILCHFTNKTDMEDQNFQFFLSKEGVLQNQDKFNNHIRVNYLSKSESNKNIKINTPKSILLKNKTSKNRTTNLVTKTPQDFNALYNVELLACLFNSGIVSKSGQSAQKQIKVFLENLQDIRVVTKESLAHISQISFKNTFETSDYFTYMASHLINSIVHKASNTRKNKDTQNVKNAATFIELIGKFCILKEKGKYKIDDNFDGAMLYLVQNFEKTIALFKPAFQLDGLKSFIAKSIEYVDYKNGNEKLSKEFEQFTTSNIEHYDLDDDLLDNTEVFQKLVASLNIGKKDNLIRFKEFDETFNSKNSSYEEVTKHSHDSKDPTIALLKIRVMENHIKTVIMNEGKGRGMTQENAKPYKDIQNIFEQIYNPSCSTAQIINKKRELIKIVEENKLYSFKTPLLHKWKNSPETINKYNSYVSIMTEIVNLFNLYTENKKYSLTEFDTVSLLRKKLKEVNLNYDEPEITSSSHELKYSREEIENLYKEKLKLHLETENQSEMLKSVLTNFDNRLNNKEVLVNKNYTSIVEKNKNYKSLHSFIKLGNMLTSKRGGNFNFKKSQPGGIKEINELIDDVFNNVGIKKNKL